MVMANEGMAEVQNLNGNGLGGVRFEFMAVGTDSTSASASDSTLGAEITGSGLARESAGTIQLTTSSFTNDTVQFENVWNVTNNEGINEFGVFNDSSADSGELLLRQVFASVLNVRNGDTLTLTVDVTASGNDNNPQSSAGEKGRVLTNEGIAEGNRLYAATLGGTRYSHMALGTDDGSTTLLDASNSTLGSEITSNGLSRQSVDTITRATTNFTNDTLRFDNQWTATGTQSVREVGVFNDSTADTGEMFIRHVFANDLNLVDTDDFTMTVDIVNT